MPEAQNAVALGLVTQNNGTSCMLKKIYDDYQKIKCIDLWTSHYEEMQEQKEKLLYINSMLRRQMRQRVGGDLEDLGLEELQSLEQDMDKALDIIRAQKEAKFQAPHSCLAREDEEGYEGASAYGHYVGGSGGNNCMYGSCSDPCNPNIMQFHGGGHRNASIHDLRRA
ncbi:hypothetical protein Cgig2_007443 [Carnegiea gigantea]|uniref:K-box domain-containing protein n=1 Tax=Carnegiea gigantea TaxID=171969 RepID=A0A9Q1KZK6_9CARY|nr:hypothetical protein Cgig2_007443 [Carnegiea gigantea]